jgi:transposase-like protein
MKAKRHSPDQIIARLREADAMLAGGAPIAPICQKLEISEQTFHRWRNQFGGMKASEAKRLKELERENTRLKRLVADLSLDNRMRKDIAEGNG